MTGQAEALRLAISRALIKIDPEKKPLLKSNGLLTEIPVRLNVKNRDNQKQEKDSSSANVKLEDCLVSKPERLPSGTTSRLTSQNVNNQIIIQCKEQHLNNFSKRVFILAP